MANKPLADRMKVADLSYRSRLAAVCRNAAAEAEGRAWAYYRAGLLREVARELERAEAEGRAQARGALGA